MTFNEPPASSSPDPLIADYDENAWFGHNGVQPDPAQDPIGRAIRLLSQPQTMGNLETLISESYKFIRMADDLHDVARYLNDMRICFLALTITGYLLLIGYCVLTCVRRTRRQQRGVLHGPRRRAWEPVASSDWPPSTGVNDDLVSVRSDGGSGGGVGFGRNHRAAPSFMRHGLNMNHAQQTTRLMGDHHDGGGTIFKHSVPHITTEAPSDDGYGGTKSGGGNRIPELVQGAVDI